MLQLAIATIVFYTLHTLFAGADAKQWAAQKLGLLRWYRLLYTLQSLLLFAWIIYAYRAVSNAPLIDLPTWTMIAGWVLIIAGVGIAAAAVLRFGAAVFVGLVPERNTGLVRSGMHGIVRHPIYSGIILMALGWAMLSPTAPTLIVVLISFAYLPLGIRSEERKLIALFGDEYVRYKLEVPALIPRLHVR